MKFPRILLSTHAEQIGGESKEIWTFLNHSITTYGEENISQTDNELWILNENQTIVRINDVRFLGVWADVMRFTGYLQHTFAKYKTGTKIDVTLWH